MEVRVEVKNGIRTGKFKVGNIEGNVPSQAMVHPTNFNYMNAVGNQSIDFGSRFLEIYFKKDLSIFERIPEETEADKIANAMRQRVISSEVGRLNGIIDENPDKLCMMVLASSKSRQINKQVNLSLIRFQISAGFKCIKVYFKNNRNALEQLDEYMKIIPENRYLIPVLDEKLNNEIFEALYMKALGKVPIIGFMGRNLTERDENIRMNYLFILSRKEDSVIRLVSEISKTTPSGNSKSLLYKWVGYDVFSFMSRATRYHVQQPLRVIQNFRYVNLASNPNIMCEVNRGRRLSETAESLRADNKETIPCSIYSHIELNREFENLADSFTHEQLRTTLQGDLRVLIGI
jgi:hypothetical protein